jgi:hypothetical protein
MALFSSLKWLSLEASVTSLATALTVGVFVVVAITVALVLVAIALAKSGLLSRRGGDASPRPQVSPEAAASRPPAKWIEMRTRNGDAIGVLVQYSAEESKRILTQFASLELNAQNPWHGGNLGGAIVDQLSSASTMVASGLQAGQVFQMIGTSHLIEGLRAGTHVLMQTAEGTLGTVASSSTGQIAGQLRFAPASIAPILAPMVAWQVLHAIAGTYQLQEINKRLDAMQRKLETLQGRNEASVLGEVLWAVQTLDDIRAERANTGTFTPVMDTRLAHVEKTIGSILQRNRALLELFRTKASSVHRLGGTQGAVSASALLLEEGSQAVHDMELLMGLIAADMRVEECRLYSTMEGNPKDVQRRLDRVTKKLGEYQEVMDELPSVEGLERHAKACVEEMRWWERHVFARGAVKDVSRLSNLQISDVQLPKSRDLLPATTSYIFWKEHDGATHVRMLPVEEAVSSGNEGEVQMSQRTVIPCPNCTQDLRVPADRGMLILTCPRCKHKWEDNVGRVSN